MRLPDGVRVEKVKFGRGEIKLGGTLLVPKTTAAKRVPAVLFVPGSDLGAPGVAIARAPQAAFRDLAALLAGNGMAVLRYDSRCTGSSNCSSGATPSDYAEDAADALTYLRRRSEVDPMRVVVIGHDEGATFACGIAANALNEKDKISGLILIAAPGRNYGKILREQAQKRLSQAGKSEAEMNDYLSKFDRIAAKLAAGNLDLAAERIDPKDPLFAEFVKNRNYFFHVFINDPLQVIRGVAVPVLIVQGEKDMQIGVRDAQYLAEALKRQYHSDATLELLPEMDHWLRRPKAAGTFRDEEQESDPIDPTLIQLLKDWLQKRMK